jgi:hypothetical protein
MNQLLPGMPEEPLKTKERSQFTGVVLWGPGFIRKLPKRVFHIRYTKTTESYGPGDIGECFATLMGMDLFTMTEDEKGFAKHNKIPLVHVSAREDHGKIKFTVW